jgi:hypothetical protein
MQYLVTLKVKPGTSEEQLGLLKSEAAKAWEMNVSGVLCLAH